MGGELKKIIYEFSQWTSCAGLPNIGGATNLPWLFFWVSVVGWALVMMVWQSWELILQYYEYEVSVAIDLGFERRAFPAVTICDLNPYSNRGLQAYHDVQDLMDTFNHALSSSIRRNEDNETEEYHWQWAYRMEKYGLQNLNDTVALQSKANDMLVLIMGQYNETDKRKMSPTLSDLVKSCSFNLKDCNLEDDFVEFFDAKLGLCYTFHHQDPPKYISHKPGPLNGLRMVLKTNTSDYIPLTEMSGFRVLIHNQTDIPFPDTYGFNLKVGSSIAMSVSFRHLIRLPEPHGECQEDTPDSYIFDGNYTTEGCFRQCYQAMVEKRCGCGDPNYPIISDQMDKCKLENATQRNCWYGLVSSSALTEEEEAEEEDCPCLAPCEGGLFDVTLSTALWPAPSIRRIADCEPDRDSDPGDEEAMLKCNRLYSQNGAFLEVFYEQINYQLIEENEEYGLINLASDFGGQIGLWLGLTALSMLEFVLLGGQIVGYFYRTLKARIFGTIANLQATCSASVSTLSSSKTEKDSAIKIPTSDDNSSREPSLDIKIAMPT